MMHYAKAYTWDGMTNLKKSLQRQGYLVRVKREGPGQEWTLTYVLKPKGGR